MHLPLCKKAPLLLAALVAGLIVAAGIAVAHDDREVGDYLLTVGFRNEPAVEGLANGIDLKVEKKPESGGDGAMESEEESHGDAMGEGGGHHESTVAVEGLEQTLQVEVTHVASGVSRTLPLRPVLGEPGVYTARPDPDGAGRLYGAVLRRYRGEPGRRDVRVGAGQVQ